MSTEDEAVIARALHNRAREVRVIRALYPQECLNHFKKPRNSEAIAASPAFSRTYHNTGVQTLPPANGDVFILIHDLHGRELSHNDYARSMGSAGIGRLSNDPRMNPYELMYGSAYDAPTTAKKETFTDSGFQTASHDTRRKALARAKVKASMTANKYRNAASEAGYVICAESRDEMIVHSEQFPSAVQLDAEGNLLEGDVKSESLPNIYGAPVHYEPSEAAVTQEVAVQQMESNLKQPRYIEHGAQTSHAPYPSPLHTPRAPSQAITAELQKAATSVSALAPAAVEQDSGATSIIDNEYGSGEPATDEFVVYDADAEHEEPKVPGGSTKTSQAKRKASENDTDERSHKKYKSSAQVNPQSPLVSLVPLAITPPKKPDQSRSDLPLTPETNCRASQVPSRTSSLPPGDISQDCMLNLIETGTPSKPTSKSDLSTPTDASRVQESNSWWKMSPSQSADERGLVANAELSSPSKARDPSHVVPAVNEPDSARLTQENLEPTVSSAKVGTEPTGLEAKAADLISRRSKRAFEDVDAEPANGEQNTTRARKIVGGHHSHHQNRSPHQEASSREEWKSSSYRNAATEANSQTLASGAAIGTDRTASGRMKKTSVSHASRPARRPMAPYVPPAKRPRDQNGLDSERKKRR